MFFYAFEQLRRRVKFAIAQHLFKPTMKVIDRTKVVTEQFLKNYLNK